MKPKINKIELTAEMMKRKGYPAIRYSKDGKTFEQVFYTEKSLKLRVKDLISKGFEVERLQ